MGVLKEPENQNRASLKALALQLLCKKIQVGPHGGHSSVEDAVTARELCRLVQVQWEPQAASSLSLLSSPSLGERRNTMLRPRRKAPLSEANHPASTFCLKAEARLEKMQW